MQLAALFKTRKTLPFFLPAWVFVSLVIPWYAQAQPLAPASGPAATPPATSALDASLFYQLLLGELQWTQNDPGAAYSLLLDAAHKTQRPELYRRAVDMALQARSGNAALTAASDWATTLPADADAHRYKLQILLALNRPADIAPPLRKLIQLATPDARQDIIAAIPQLVSRASDKAAALQAARQALAPSLKDPDTATQANAWHSLGRLQASQPDLSAALASARQALQAVPSFLPAAGLALELMAAGQTGAETLVRQFLQTASLSPNTAARDTVQLGLARVLTEQRQHAAAQQELDALLSARPGNAEAWLLQGALFQQQRLWPQAQSALTRYLELSQPPEGDHQRRGRVQAMLQLSTIAEQQGDYASAQRWLDQITDAPDPLLVHIHRANLLAKEGRLNEARSLLRQAPVQNQDDRQRLFMTEAHLLRDQGQHEAALQVLAEARQQFPKEPDLLYEQAMTAEKAGQLGRMEQLLRELMALDPAHHHAFNALGYAWADRNTRLPEAKALIQQALALAPNDPFILDSLGWVEFRLGNLPEALRVLQTAFKLRPDPEIAAHLGEVHWALGQQVSALAIWRESLQLHPQNDTLRETMTRHQVLP